MLNSNLISNENVKSRSLSGKEVTISNVNDHALFKSQEVKTALADFVAMRRKMKRPLTDRGVLLNMVKLVGLSGGDEKTAVRIIDQSIERTWQGLFALQGA